MDEPRMSPLNYGVSIPDAAAWFGVPEANIRKWLARGNIDRAPDGQVDMFSLKDWVETKRDQGKAKRTGIHAAGQPRWDRKQAG